MLQRCSNPNDSGYCWYGGRGITVCKRWHTFENFYADMGDPPSGLTLDRKDNDGNYEKRNCKWSTPAEQRLNQRKRKHRRSTAEEIRAFAAAMQRAALRPLA